MLIGLCGLKFTGKRTFSTILHDLHNFTIVKISSEPSPPGTERILHFGSVVELVNWVTERWQEDFVWPEIETVDDYEQVAKRPFFLLIQLKAPTMQRFERSGLADINELVLHDDDLIFKGDGLMRISSHASYTFINCASVTKLKNSLRHLSLGDVQKKKRLTRPEWDEYFMTIAHFAAKRTNCMKRGVGAVLVQDTHILATGYNGTARGLTNCLSGGCGRCNSNVSCGQLLDSCLCLHAEENALLEAGRARSMGTTLYTTTAPCLSCAKKICQMGVKRVVFARHYSIEHFTERLMKEAGIELEKFSGNLRQVVINCADENENEDVDLLEDYILELKL